MNYLVDTFDKKETLLLRKIHFPMTLITALKAIENNVSNDSFHSWVNEFKNAFKPKKNSVINIPTSYEEFTGAGSTRKEKADGRLNEMIRHFNEIVSLK